MIVLAIVVLFAVATGALLVGGRHAVSAETPLDVEPQEQWLLRHAPASWSKVLRRLDRRAIGGAAVVVTFLVVLGVASLVGWIFAGIDRTSGLARWDQSAAEFGRDNATDTSTSVLTAVTDLGGTLVLFAVMAVVGIVISVRRSNWGPLIYLGAVGGGVSLLNNGLKLIVDRPRPDIAQLAGYAGSSFPSGHSAAAAACWAAIALVATRRSRHSVRVAAAFLAITVGAAVAATRVLLGVHWLSDVVAGVLVGWGWFFVVTLLFGGRLLRLGEPAERLADRDDAETDHATNGDTVTDADDTRLHHAAEGTR